MKSSKFKIRSIIAAFVVTSFLSSFYPFENSNAYADEYDASYDDNIEYNEEKQFGDFSYIIEYSNAITITKYNGKEDTITIPSEIDGFKVTSIDRNAFNDTLLKKVYLPNTLVTCYAENENIKLIRNFKVDNFNVYSDNYNVNKNVNISCSASNLGDADIDFVRAIFTIENDEGYKKTYEKPMNDDGSVSVDWIPEQIGKYKISIILKDYLGETEDINKVIEIKDDTYEYSFSATPSEFINLGESINLKAYENDALEYSFLAEKGNEVKTLRDFSKDNEFIWTPYESGKYDLYVDIKCEDGTIERRTIYNDYVVKGDSSEKLQEIKDALYYCFLNSLSFDMKDYLNEDEIDSFARDNQINTLDDFKKYRVYAQDDYYAKAYMICKYLAKNMYYEKSPYATINGVVVKTGDNKTVHISYNFITKEKLEKSTDIIEDFKKTYIKDNYTELEKEIAVVTYLINNCTYDYDAFNSGRLDPDNHSEVGVFLNNRAVCQGYSEACQHLLTSVGIESYIVTSSKLNHQWNIVKIDGKYYQLDVTAMDNGNYISYDCFNFSNDDEMHNEDDLTNMNLYLKCTNKDFEEFDATNYSLSLNKILKERNGSFYLTDVYDRNYKYIQLPCDKIDEYHIYNDYLYYITHNGETYSFNKFNLLTNENTEIQKLPGGNFFYINGNNIVTGDGELLKINDEKPYPKKYTVTFKNGDEVIDIQRVKEGDKPEIPKSIPKKQGYTFSEWENTSNQSVISDVVINPVYTPNTYTVTFKDYDGTVLDSRQVLAGSTINVSADYKRLGYKFVGWKVQGTDVYDYSNLYKDEYSDIVSDVVLEAVYKPIFYYNVNDDDTIEISYVDEEMVAGFDSLYIPDIYEGHVVSSIRLYGVPENIKTLTISDKITRLENLVLSLDSNVEEVYIYGKMLIDNISIASFNKLKIYTDKDSIIEQYVKNYNFDYIINGQDYKNNNSNKDDDNNIGKDDTVDKDDVTDKNDTSNNDDITDKGHDTDKDEGNIEDKGEDIKKPSVGDNEEPKKEGDNSNILLLMAALILTLPILIKRKNILKKYK